MESKTPGSARNVQEIDERWPALTNAQNLSYTLKVNEVGYKVWSGLRHLVNGGGFGADLTQISFLAQYRPDLLHLPTANDEHCTGDVNKMCGFVGKAGIRDRRDVENPVPSRRF